MIFTEIVITNLYEELRKLPFLRKSFIQNHIIQIEIPDSVGVNHHLRILYDYFLGDEEDKMRTLDECVQGDYPECLEPLQVLIKYFCGTDMKKCGMMNRHVGHDWTKVS